LLNGRISYRFENGIELAVFGDNLANKNYYSGIQDLSSLGLLIGSAGNPRTYGISLRAPFGGD
jgi:iron complex outermembrane receptor protein